MRGSPDFPRSAAKEFADDEGWPESWLNDGGKGFRSSDEEMELMEGFPGASQGGPRIYVPTASYIFAMKCMAMRPEGIDGSHDVSDIEFLADRIGVQTPDAAFSIIDGFHPASRIPAKVRFDVEEIMERLFPLPDQDS